MEIAALLTFGGIALLIALVPGLKSEKISIPKVPLVVRWIAGIFGSICCVSAAIIIIWQGLINIGFYPPSSEKVAARATVTRTETLITVPTNVVEKGPGEVTTVRTPTEGAPDIPITGQNTPPAVGEYEAAFILPLAPGIWPTGIHNYVIEFACSTNIEKPFQGNNGFPVMFTVKELNIFDTSPSFFLRYNAVYDAMTYGNQINPVNQSSPSYASVIITRHTYEEAQRVLDECNAFISVDNLPNVNLNRIDHPVSSVQEINLEDFPLLKELP